MQTQARDQVEKAEIVSAVLIELAECHDADAPGAAEVLRELAGFDEGTLARLYDVIRACDSPADAADAIEGLSA